ncbi:unnamed protein product (macronuclear) [Paramecium tetraurelia]|uniref:Uncharacterized protein n=1 Tax=Paramecium tetraurelia TaxID=5888 RepID=A0DJ33_PARTE|nr:uncharacterized protein GSPATT00017407001 [Paramecium tetraurelia]CAK83050.1 unnamed protein product [Paramecium tetraurelia]|eukprot:XP_001450447.1 hypothetical protein (macronuclear) [Paramecium tetraurelia strain d4-2]
MNKDDIIGKRDVKETYNYDILADDRVSLFSSIRESKKENQKTLILSTQPTIYCCLSICSFLIALSNLPEEDRIYFFYDDPLSYNVGLVVCMCFLCILGIVISDIIKKSFTNKQIGTLPFLTKKQHKMNFNATICLAGQIAHLLLLIEIILQAMPTQLFQHETLVDLSFLLNVVYFAYANSCSDALYTIFHLYLCHSCIVLCQNNSMKLQYTHIWKVQTERVILTYMGIMLQGIQFQLFRPAIKEMERNQNILAEVL